VIVPLAMLFLSACGGQTGGDPGVAKTQTISQASREQKKQQPAVAAAQPKAPEKKNIKPVATASPVPSLSEEDKDPATEKVDWGREITLNEIITMAKSGHIREIEWHVMPNVIRVFASDGRIFHLKNENKGVDMRNTLIGAGVKIGKEGIIFRHVF
jgi:hypothetical protein